MVAVAVAGVSFPWLGRIVGMKLNILVKIGMKQNRTYLLSKHSKVLFYTATLLSRRRSRSILYLKIGTPHRSDFSGLPTHHRTSCHREHSPPEVKQVAQRATIAHLSPMCQHPFISNKPASKVIKNLNSFQIREQLFF